MAAWDTAGNTTSTGNFLGTNNSQPLVVKTAGMERARIDELGRLGIGTANPVFMLDVAGYVRATYTPDPRDPRDQGPYFPLSAAVASPAALGAVLALANPGGGFGSAVAIDLNTFALEPQDPPYPGIDPSSRIMAIHTGNFATDIIFLSKQPGAAANSLVERLRITSTGALNITGDIIPTTGLLRILGNVAAADIILAGADCAEHFNMSGPNLPEPGTVVVIDKDGGLRESRDEYDKKVAGVVSGAGEFRPGIFLNKKSAHEDGVALALVGRAYCKADADYCSIEVGDLLTTSLTPGHAMKANQPTRAFGAVVGKALKPLKSGRQLIPILLTLQ